MNALRPRAQAGIYKAISAHEATVWLSGSGGDIEVKL